jgi:putative ABC transport system permease protein
VIVVPLKYNLRSLRARKVGSLMTILGVALVVWASIFAFGLSSGLDKTLKVAADPLDIIVMRKGSTSEAVSAVSDEVARAVMALPGIATDRDSRPLAASELVIFGYLPRRGEKQPVNISVRGVTPVSRELRTGMNIVEGRDFKPGLREAIVSRALAERFQDCGLGEEFPLRGATFQVVGVFEAGGGAVESEIWTDQPVLAELVHRSGAMSCLQLRAASKPDQDKLIQKIKTDEQIDLNAMTEQEYFAEQSDKSMLIKIVGNLIAVVLTIGAMFAVANTMYGAIASRAREIGTLRALGFGRFSILFSFLLESLVLCGLGALLGCLGALALGDIRTGTMNAGTFTEVVFSFNFGPKVLATGALLAIAMGLIGGLAPAVRAVRMKVVNALREV